MYGQPALPPDFVALPYVNADAPKGGRIVLGEPGSFDSLNPFVRRGTAPYGIAPYVFQTLMGRNWDEPFSLYGLLAESVEVGPNRDWVEFTLRAQARFSDGSPVTVEDVAWSMEILGTEGHPRYLAAASKLASTEITGPRSIRFTFNTPDRELPLIMGLRPILKKAQWDGVDFAASGLTVTPIGSGPYVIEAVEPGRYLRLRKDPDWWAADLPLMRGQMNFDEIRWDYYRDAEVIFEAFKAGEIDAWREDNAARWVRDYHFPRLTSGAVVQTEVPHRRPSGIRGFVMNARLPVFADWRVRQAMIEAFNYEFIAQTLNAGGDPRITSYFSNSALGMGDGPAEGRVLELLEPFRADLPPGAIEGYTLPQGDPTERNRRGIRAAAALLEEAGWTVQDGVLKNAAGTPFTFEILLAQGVNEPQQMIDLYLPALARLGIFPTVTIVDAAQYVERTGRYDFGMAWYRRDLSLSPGNELYLYWGKAGLTQPGSFNWMAVATPAVEALISAILTSEDAEEAAAATRALDRVMTAGRHVIPAWFPAVSRLAHRRELRFPQPVSLYGDYIGFLPDVWWWEE